MGKQSAAHGDAMRKAVATAAKALILEIDAELRKSTPVDTGHARANWVPSVGTPHSGTDSGSAHATGVAAVVGYELGPPLFESNNVDYISRLNYGHSKQAPALFVESAVERAQATMQARLAGKGVTIGGSDD